MLPMTSLLVCGEDTYLKPSPLSFHAKLARRNGEKTREEFLSQANHRKNQKLENEKKNLREKHKDSNSKSGKQDAHEGDSFQESWALKRQSAELKNDIYKVASALAEVAAREAALEKTVAQVAAVEEQLAKNVARLEEKENNLAANSRTEVIAVQVIVGISIALVFAGVCAYFKAESKDFDATL